MTPLNRFILQNLTSDNCVNEAIAESGIDVDAMTFRFFKKAEKVRGNTRYFSGCLPESAIGFLSNNINDAVVAKLELLLATSRNITFNSDDVFRLAISQVQANPDSDDAPTWLALAAVSAKQVVSNDIPF